LVRKDKNVKENRAAKEIKIAKQNSGGLSI
jgi:hypothetical protein